MEIIKDIAYSRNDITIFASNSSKHSLNYYYLKNIFLNIQKKFDVLVCKHVNIYNHYGRGEDVGTWLKFVTGIFRQWLCVNVLMLPSNFNAI